MKILFKCAFVALAALSAQAAQALVVFSTANLGRKVEVKYSGLITANGTKTAAPALSVTTLYTLSSISADGKSWTFDYVITNTSSVVSRLMAVGFEANPDTGNTADVGPSAVTATGKFNNYFAGGQFPVGYGRVDVCLGVNSNNCTGGNANNGLLNTGANTAAGSFILKFANRPLSLTLDKFVTRFQAISPAIQGQNSGIGIRKEQKITNGDGSPGPVPEPAQWIMLIGGFGVTGAALRRRKFLPAA